MRAKSKLRKNANAESSGCHVEANIWIKLGLSKSQAERLRTAAKALLKPEHRTSATAAWYLLNAAIQHLPLLHALIHKQEGGVWRFEVACERESRAVLKQL